MCLAWMGPARAQDHQHPALSLPDAVPGDGQANPCPLVLPVKDLGHVHRKRAWSNSVLAPPCSPAELRVHQGRSSCSLLPCPASQQDQLGSLLPKSESQAASEGSGLEHGTGVAAFMSFTQKNYAFIKA